MTAPPNPLRELDHRTNDGIEVQLLWDPRTDRVSVALTDARSGEMLHFDVDGADALDAFRHPYAYAFGDRPELRGPLAGGHSEMEPHRH